ncbi:MAG: PepSY-associated TM helix domain-containing protein [Pseudomonadota bacterium]|nr:PepSY-associated TM helix domain-containing protein [Pseudomonadota bacterium]
MSSANVVRQLLVKVHRYVGLTLAPFIIVIAATGSIIAFYDELERTFNSRLRVVEPQAIEWTLQEQLAIRERLEAQDPRSHVFSLQFAQRPDESVFSRVMGAIDPATGAPYELDYNEVFANPYTGERLGQRFIGHFSLQPEDLISQIYYLHYALVLPDVLGMLLIGSLGLVWAFDCFVGFYLTLPPGGGAKRKPTDAPRKSFFTRWKPAWQIKRGAGTNRLVYDVHRAKALWIWPLMLMFAWTGFALNLPGPYARVMNSISDYEHLQELPHRPPLAEPLEKPPIDWSQALQLGTRYMAEQAREQGFELGRAAALEYRRDLGMYFYLAHTSRDLRDGSTPTESDSTATAATVAIDARDGSLLGVQIPTGQRVGNTVTSWLIALHVTALFGLPWQIAVSVFGLLVIAITVTGVLIWWRKRRGSRQRVREARGAAPTEHKALVPERPA